MASKIGFEGSSKNSIRFRGGRETLVNFPGSWGFFLRIGSRYDGFEISLRFYHRTTHANP